MEEKVVLDLNTIISGALFHGNEAEILDLVRSGKVKAIISRKMIERLATALSYPHLARYLHGKKPADVIASALKNFEIVDDVEEKHTFHLDSDDSTVLQCAVHNNTTLISGDKKLLEIKAYRNTRIISSVNFLKRL